MLDSRQNALLDKDCPELGESFQLAAEAALEMYRADPKRVAFSSAFHEEVDALARKYGPDVAGSFLLILGYTMHVKGVTGQELPASWRKT